ncbi:MAG TPA: RHS repeat-associated core domain-containing protein, partial [Gemmatimonadales bacterium]|nr:RHS repeat-associated core domain-containing protein [Gemmatimonadales bacterium]
QYPRPSHNCALQLSLIYVRDLGAGGQGVAHETPRRAPARIPRLVDLPVPPGSTGEAFGNSLWEATTGETGFPTPAVSQYNISGHQTRRDALTPTNTANCSQAYPDSLKQAYDGMGNLASRVKVAYVGGYNPCTQVQTSLDREWHWYGADNVLRYVQREAGDPTHVVRTGTWEEYQYDALGRRILLRERRDTLANGTNMESALTQTLWDGSQILYELRNQPPSPDKIGPTPRYGTIGYIHGRDIDAPLALTDGRIPVPDWRGSYQATVFANGAKADCATGQGAPCMAIELPGGNLTATYRPWAGAGESGVMYTWRGSLLLAGRSGSGLMYRRNRYYDPLTGRFTQTDPIGLAGGANLYGFASRDLTSSQKSGAA